MNQIRLDDVLARDTAVQWYEGVAILQLICRSWRAQGMDDSRFPNAGDVVLAPGGTVGLTGAATGSAVQAAAHLLARMLSDDVPVRLRLIVSQATAAEAASTSLAAFSEELRYFERPDLEAIVDGVRRRALLAAPRALTAAPQPADTPPKARKDLTSPDPGARRRVSGWAVAAVAVSAAACACVWVIGRTSIRASVPAAAIEEPESPAVDKTAQAPRASRPASAPAPHISAAAAASTTNMPPGPAARIESTPDVALPAALPSHTYLDRIQLVDIAPVFASEPIVSAPAVSGDDDVDRIYTRTDANVTLPLNVYPKFPTQSAASDTSRRAVLELTIAKDGLVEGVKMLTAPRNIHEFMLLSAVKAWRFEPARLGGRAIRFRQTLTIDASTIGWMGPQ